MDKVHCRNMTESRMQFLNGQAVGPGMNVVIPRTEAVDRLLDQGTMIELPTFNVGGDSDTMTLSLANDSVTGTLANLMQRRLMAWTTDRVQEPLTERVILEARVDMLDYLTELVQLGRISRGPDGRWGVPELDGFDVAVK